MTDFAPEAQPWRSFNILVVSPTPTHPQDHGNRKRIFEICAALKQQGARIHFVHYPGEHDWRRNWPARQEAAMRAAWDSYQLVAPSRPLHENAIGDDHTIDEWADPDLNHFIAWAFSVRAYDLVIVNYTWMSFCFDAVPAHVFKVCDTHDVFGGRRALLQANGIEPEFFHTTPDEERKGLERADLVWAIKDSERVYFEKQLGLPNCLTMLHAEADRGWWRQPPSRDGYLRAGVIGARNNVNRRNLEEFLAEALPILENYMAPVKIVIAGGCSDDFEHLRHPNVEILGRVPTVEGFYHDVDIVLAPMQFSTGLKIKVSEALSSGAPLLAHAHAMEGYPTREPLHLMDSFRQMAFELVKLSFDPAPLPRLARVSRKVGADIQSQVNRGLEATRQQLLARISKTLCVIAPMHAFDTASILHDHLAAALDYLRFRSNITVYVTGEPAKNARLEILEWYGVNSQVFADPRLLETLGEKAPDSWEGAPLADLLAARRYARAYVMADCAEDLSLSTHFLRQVYVRHDAIGLAGGDADAVVRAARERADVIVIGAAPADILPWQGRVGVLELVHAPLRRSSAFQCFAARKSPRVPNPYDLLVLASGRDGLARKLLRLCEKLEIKAHVLDPHDPLARAIAVNGGAGDPLVDLWRAGLVVDLSSGAPLAAILAEAALRMEIPCLTLNHVGGKGLQPQAAPLFPSSPAQLFRTIARFAADPDFKAELKGAAIELAASRHKSDAGWAKLWRLLTQAVDARSDSAPDAAAKLWGSF